jgi:adenosylcobinamide-phosphate synthase
VIKLPLDLFRFLTFLTAPLLTLLLAIVIDFAVGEPFGPPYWKPPYTYHPTHWISVLASKVKWYFKSSRPRFEKIGGTFLALMLIVAFTVPIYFVLNLLKSFNLFLYVVVAAFLLKFTFDIKTEKEYALRAVQILREGDIAQGREMTSMWSRRNVKNLNSQQIVSAIIGSMAENLADFKLSPIFYFGLFGVPGAFAYKVVNILDLTIGFKDPENVNVGWFSAVLDTIVNYIPQRLCAFLIILASAILREDYKNSWNIARRDQAKIQSINHGWPVAAMAGALRVQLEKLGYYVVGDEIEELSVEHIIRALRIRIIAILLFFLFVLIPLILFAWVGTSLFL